MSIIRISFYKTDIRTQKDNFKVNPILLNKFLF